MDEIPETDKRTAAVFAAWRDAKGLGPLETKAAEKFSKQAGYELVRDVPVFKEHEYHRDAYKRADGSEVPERNETYDLSKLRMIVDRCNYRIADTSDFSPLCEGHLDGGSIGQKLPLGFSGPFRLGMIGNVEPKWAIFADEHHKLDCRELLRSLPRRSPEVWMTQDPSQRFFDPIAALGSETPRLDMGINYGRLKSGEVVEKYSAAFAGPMSVSVPAPVTVDGKSKSQKQNYSEESGTMLSPEDIKQIIDGLMETDLMKFVQGLKDQIEAAQDAVDQQGDPVAEGDPAADPNSAAATGEPSAAPPGDAPPAAPPAAPPTAPAAAAPPPAAPDVSADPKPDTPPAGPPASPDDDPDKKKETYSMTPEMKALYSQQNEEIKALKARLNAADAEKVAITRQSRIMTLRRTHAFDENKAVAYSKSLNDEQFEGYLGQIVDMATPIPIDQQFIPTPGLEAPARRADEAEKYSRDCSERAVQLVMAARGRGENTSYEDCLAKAQAELSPKSAAV